jgi:hypothetical protein
MKPQDESTEVNGGDLGLGKKVLDTTRKAQKKKKLIFKLKHICASMDTIKKELQNERVTSRGSQF